MMINPCPASTVPALIECRNVYMPKLRASIPDNMMLLKVRSFPIPAKHDIKQVPAVGEQCLAVAAIP